MEFLSYLFSPFPGSQFNYSTEMLIYAGILIVLGFVVKAILIVKKHNKALKKSLKSSPSEFIWTGLILIVITLSRTNAIPYLSMRFLLYLIIALSLLYIGLLIFRLVKKYPEMKEVVKPKKTVQEKEAKYTTGKKRK
jgi:hypothetical protein